MTAPLEGLKVLDLAWVVAGPLVGRVLADFGATVVRVESRSRIDSARRVPPFYGGIDGLETSAVYGTCNAGKLSLTLDLKTDKGQEIVKELASWADVVIESFALGQLAKWGLDYEQLSGDRDDLIMLSSTLMGQTGPQAAVAGFGNSGAAYSGFQHVAGWREGLPVGPYGPYTDYVGPRFALAALLAAIDRRERTGKGCYIDASQVEAGIFFLSPECADYFDQETVAERMGNEDRDFAPHGVYRAESEGDQERFIAIAVTNNEQWASLTHLLGMPQLRTDPRFSDAAARRAHCADLDEMISAWTATQSAVQLEDTLQCAGIPSHIAVTSEDFATDVQLRHRGHLVRLEHPDRGEVVVEGPRYLLSDTPGVVHSPAPTYGEHTTQVLKEILGYSDEVVRQLEVEGVLQ